MFQSCSLCYDNVVFNPGDSFEESVEIMNEGENEKPSETTTENLNGVMVQLDKVEICEFKPKMVTKDEGGLVF